MHWRQLGASKQVERTSGIPIDYYCLAVRAAPTAAAVAFISGKWRPCSGRTRKTMSMPNATCDIEWYRWWTGRHIAEQY